MEPKKIDFSKNPYLGINIMLLLIAIIIMWRYRSQPVFFIGGLTFFLLTTRFYNNETTNS